MGDLAQMFVSLHAQLQSATAYDSQRILFPNIQREQTNYVTTTVQYNVIQCMHSTTPHPAPYITLIMVNFV